MSVRFVHRSTSDGPLGVFRAELGESLRQADLRGIERTLGWIATGVILILWLTLDWPSSVLLALMGLQLLVATSPRRT